MRGNLKGREIKSEQKCHFQSKYGLNVLFLIYLFINNFTLKKLTILNN